MAVGDGGNDFELVLNCGVGVAMANAIPKVHAFIISGSKVLPCLQKFSYPIAAVIHKDDATRSKGSPPKAPTLNTGKPLNSQRG